jgi:hypothetical protein
MPYAYDPVVVFPEGRGPRGLKTLQATIDYSTKLATFRPGSEFAMVAKGWTTIRLKKLEHESDLLLGPLDEPYILGEWPHAFIDERARERQPRWDYVNAAWLENYSAALRFFREIRATSAAPMTVLALIEEGFFEQHIQVSAALLGEMLWNPRREQKQYLERAINPYYYGSLLQ